MNTQVIFYLVNLYLLILPHGVIPTNRQVMIKTSVLTSIGQYLVLRVYLLLHSAPDTGNYIEANNLFHPIAVKLNDGYDASDEHSFQLQTGSKTMPEYPMTSVTETLYQLRKTVGNPLHIYGRWYRSHKYIIGFDLEKSAELDLLAYRRKAVTN